MVSHAGTQYSNIAKDETVTLFNVDAFRAKNGKWVVPLHGWVYELEDSQVRKSLIESTIQLKYGLKRNEDNAEIFDRRINLLIADNERGKKLVFDIGGQEFRSPRTKANGHFLKKINLDNEFVNSLRTDGNSIRYCAILKNGDDRQFCGNIRFVEKTGISIISDIDDTVKLSEVTQRKQLINNTFYKPFQAIDGLASRYKTWARQGAVVHFVSSSPWQLYPELNNFFKSSGFPDHSMSLKYFRFKDKTFFNLFKSGLKTKPRQIEVILRKYPDRKFVLIGDSGEQDPLVYSKIRQKYPNQIIAIYIRRVENTHTTEAPNEDLENIQYFTDANSLPDSLGL